jgi:hypothetical protein
MPEPTKKSESVDRVLKHIWGKDRVETIRAGHCMMCNNEFISENFRDELSEKEYTISGLCQECQDEIFGER